MIRIWLLIWANYSKQINQNKKTTPCGSRHPKILVMLTIVPQYKHEVLKSYVNCKKKKLNQKEDVESQMKFSKRLDWTETLLTATEKHAVENILVEYHDIISRQKMNIEMNTEFKKRLTTKDDRGVYSQNLPMPIQLKEDLIVELALMHKYGIITVLLLSNYAIPIFAQRKPNGKLRLLVDLRRINTLTADDYTNKHHPVSTLSDAAKHLAGRFEFCKLDCSQAYHCLKMGDKRQWKCLL